MDETECGIEGCTGFTCALCGKCTAECPNMKCSRDAIGAQPMSGIALVIEPEGLSSDEAIRVRSFFRGSE